MKQPLHLFLALLTLLFVGCGYDDSAIIDRIENLEKNQNTKIATINEQIEAINNSIASLEAAKTDLDQRIKDAQADANANAEDIAALQEAKVFLEERITTLQSYVDNELNNANEWASATFATLEQYNALAEDVAQLKDVVDGLDEVLKNWVNEQLAGYYTIAEVDAMLEALQKSVDENNESLQKDIEELSTKVDNMKTELTDAYTKAIEEAINTNNGVIDGKIADAITAVNGRIDSEIAAISARIDALEERVEELENIINKIITRIQHVSYIPQYSDGQATVKYTGSISRVTLNFEISPKDAIIELEKAWQSAVNVKAVYTETRALEFIELPIIQFDSDVENGIITIIASGENLSDNFFSNGQTASARLAITDGINMITSDYFSLIAQEGDSSEFILPNEIWYKSIDANIVIPSSTNAFNANIESNIYNDGYGIITFDSPITEIGNSAFADCNNLQNIIMPQDITKFGSFSFKGCCNLHSIIIPNSVTEIDSFAFYGCEGLSNIFIPEGVVSVGNSAFSGCCNLAEFSGKYASEDGRCLIIDGILKSFAPAGISEYSIPSSVTKIGDSVFSNCSSLTNIYIPDSVTSIGEETFAKCDSLKIVIIGNNIKEIGHYAFENCNSLECIYCKATVPPGIGEKVFYNFSYESGYSKIGCVIYVQNDFKDDYKNAYRWDEYADDIYGYDFESGKIVTISSINLSTNHITGYIDGYYEVEANITPLNANVKYEWSVSDSRVAHISSIKDNVAKILTTDYGTTHVTVVDKISGLSATMSLDTIIEDFNWNIDFNDTYSTYPAITLLEGDTFKLDYTCTPWYATNIFSDMSEFVFYENGYVVEYPTHISISDDGVITALSVGATGIKPTGRILKGNDCPNRIFINVVDKYREKEPNNDFPYATELTSGTKMGFKMNSTSDVDIFKFTLPANRFTIKVTSDNEYTNKMLRWELYDNQYQLWGSGTMSLSEGDDEFEISKTVYSSVCYLKLYNNSYAQQYPSLIPDNELVLEILPSN